MVEITLEFVCASLAEPAGFRVVIVAGGINAVRVELAHTGRYHR